MIEIRHIEEKDQQQLAHVIRSVFEEYGAPLVNTVYDDPRTEHIFDAMAGKNAGYLVVADDRGVQGGCGYYPTEGLPDGYAELVKFYLSPGSQRTLPFLQSAKPLRQRRRGIFCAVWMVSLSSGGRSSCCLSTRDAAGVRPADCNGSR